MEKSVIVVGAGISGLSAATYAQMNGYKTAIFEMHDIPGGLCTAWERKGYTFDISMHMLTASRSGPIHRMWEELGIPGKFKFHYHDHTSLIEGMGQKLYFCTDREKLKEQMLAISPEDSALTGEFIRIIFGPDMMKAASLKPAAMRNIFDRLKAVPFILPMIRVFAKYSKVTIQEFAARFKNHFLREAVRFFIDAPGWPMPRFPMVVLSGFIKNGVTEAGVPLGGSQKVVFHIADLFRQLGGEIHYKSRVTNLIIDNHLVVGIRLADGTEERADSVIWAGDGHTLIFDILGGKYMDERIKNRYENWIPVKPIVHVMIGVDMDLAKEPHSIVFEVEDPITIAGQEHRWISLIHHSFDKTMAPEGKSAVEVWYDTEYAYWEELARDRKKYKEEKKHITEYTIAQLEKRWPGFASRVEAIDVPTPATYKHYTGNWQASPDGWYVTTDNLRDMEPLRELPGLEGLQMVGQWTAPFTGTVIAALSGRQAVQLMCRKDGKKFVTSVN